jgi:GNAT superfamily N-acetyltransferase
MNDPPAIAIAPARNSADLADAAALFREYTDGLGLDLSFQDVEAELAGLPGKYAPPGGDILLARDAAGQAIGCAAFRPLPEPGSAEMKRLYVRPAARGLDLGRRLAIAIIAQARGAGYRRLKLDTLADMQAAQRLYATLGFRPTAPYYDNPLPGTVYLSLEL